MEMSPHNQACTPPSWVGHVPQTRHREGPVNPPSAAVKSSDSAPPTFQFGGLQQFLPQTDDFVHTSRHFVLGVVIDVDQLLPSLLQGIDAALVC